MKSNIFLPKKINVGFQDRRQTYTGKLAYIVYFDEKGTLRKEKSWNGWRNQDIPNEEYTNEPTSGFVLNKKAGGYSTGWNHRQTYVRVYDPRGFEFEISVENLLYILENTSSIKGKGLEGEFVYGWNGKDLILIPTTSPDYKEMKELNERIHKNDFIKAKDLQIGATYLTKDNEQLIFMGKFDAYDWRGNKMKGKAFFFCETGERNWFRVMSAVTRKLVDVVDDECVGNYAELMDELQKNTSYSPVDPTKDEYVPYTEEEFKQKVYENTLGFRVFDYSKKYTRVRNRNGKMLFEKRQDVVGVGHLRTKDVEVDTVEELYDRLKPMYRNRYLENGSFYGRD